LRLGQRGRTKGNLYGAGKSYEKREFPGRNGCGIVFPKISPSIMGNSQKKKQQNENGNVSAILFPQ
jgi:hypothetical protein